jgi:hypothetical protein
MRILLRHPRPGSTSTCGNLPPQIRITDRKHASVLPPARWKLGQLLAGVEIEQVEAERARERQGTRTDIAEKIPQGETGRARDKAASAVGANPHYVSDAKKIAALTRRHPQGS